MLTLMRMQRMNCLIHNKNSYTKLFCYAYENANDKLFNTNENAKNELFNK